MMTRSLDVFVGLCIFGLLFAVPGLTYCGALWMPIGPWGGAIECLAQAPLNPDVLFAGPPLCKSTNGGASWEELSTPQRVGVNSVAVGGLGDETVVAATCVKGLIFVSQDGGENWQSVSDEQMKGLEILWVAFTNDTPENRQVVACTSAGLFASPDGISGWEKVGGGLPDGTALSYFTCSDPSKPCYMFACGKDIGVYRSERLESGWQRIQVTQPEEPEAKIYRIAVQWDNRDDVFACGPAGVYRSTDGGLTWTNIWRAATDRIALSRSEPSTLYAAGQFGVLMTSDSGSTWIQKNQGVVIGNWVTGDLCVSPNNSLDVWLASFFGVYRTNDGGDSWQASSTGISGVSVDSIAVSSRVPGLILATGMGSLFRKTEGSDWQLLGVAQTTTMLQPEWVKLDPCDDAAVYIWDTKGGKMTLKRSESTGDEPWETLLELDCGATGLAIDPETGQNLYLGTTANGVMVSRDRGATWAESNDGLPKDTTNWVGIITIAPSDPNVLWIGLGEFSVNDIYKSVDAGRTWTYLITLADGVNCITIDPKDSDKVYLGTALGEGVVLSILGGQTFINMGYGLLDKWVNDIAIDQNDTSLVYAATGAMGCTSFYAGLYQLNLSGTGWNRIPCPDIPQTAIRRIAIDPWTTDSVFCAVLGRSLYQYKKEIGPPIDLRLKTDRDSYTAGQTQTAFISVTNTGGDLDVDLYIAILLPDGRLLFWPDFWYDMRPCFSMTPMQQGFTMPNFPFYTVTLPDTLDPGEYTWYAAFCSQGTSNLVSNLASAEWSFGEM